MTFGREKRTLLGGLAFLAPLPLPFNEVLEWPVLLAYLVGTVWFVARGRRDPERWLPTWTMNVLGLVYMPFLAFDLLVLGRARLVHPVVHLLLFVVLVKLFSLSREKDKWHAFMGSFFLFLTAMATSVHPSIVLYLVAYLVLALLVLTRFAFLHILSGFGSQEARQALLPLGGFLTAVSIATLVVAVPLFALLPRVRSPVIVGRGVGTGTIIEAAGFTDQVTLDSIGLSRTNREVVMRLRYPQAPPPGHEMRFKAGAHHRYDGGVWRRTGYGDRPLRRSRRDGGAFRLAPGDAVSDLEVWLEPLLGPRLPLPVEAVEVAAEVPALFVSDWGTVSLGGPRGRVVQYRVGLADRPVIVADPPQTALEGEPTLDPGGITPEIADLAREVMVGTTPGERAQALEQFFYQEFEYTLDFLGRGGDEPLEDFLFRYKSGHCEYFASAMVLMLRSQGIPARLATGFLGAEYNPFEGYYIVRQLNAHAWVEAYLPGEGWSVFDPTPPTGRPVSDRSGIGGLFAQAWDYFEFRWDRYVLTYGFYDQIQIFMGLRDLWSRVTGLFGGGEEEAPEPAGDSSPTAEPETLPGAEPGELPGGRLVMPVLLLLLIAVVWLLLRRGSPLTATAAYRRLRAGLRRSGLEASDAVAPLALLRTAGRLHPAAAAPAGRIVELYLDESFGGRELDDRERGELEEAVAATRKALVGTGRVAGSGRAARSGGSGPADRPPGPAAPGPVAEPPPG